MTPPSRINVSGSQACYSAQSGSPGLARLEACNFLSGTNYPALMSTPITLYVPTSPIPSVQVASVAGQPVSSNPFPFPNLKIDTTSSVPVVITAVGVPKGTVPTLYIYSEKSPDQTLQCDSSGLEGTPLTCTIQVPAFPFGGSWGFVRATWTVQ
jgi:hypothetical protein